MSAQPSQNEKDVLEAFKFIQIPFLTWALHVVYLPMEVFLFWGTWDPARYAAFSLSAACYAAYVGLRHWAPWKMKIYRKYHGDDPVRWSSNPTAVAVASFLSQRRFRLEAALVTASAMLTPWLIGGLSHLVDGTPFGGRDPRGPEAAAMVVLGFADAARASGIPMLLARNRVIRDLASFREPVGTP